MIPKLDGTREIVAFDECPSLLFYKNVEYEDYPSHWHTSAEIIMPIENGYSVTCNGRTYDLNVGDIIIVAPGVIHSMPATKGTRYIFLVNFANSFTSKSFDSILSLIQPAALITPERFPSIYQRCYNRIINSADEYFGNEPFKEVSIYSDLMRLFLLIGRSYTTQNEMFSDTPMAKQQEYMNKFMSLCDYINDNCTENLTVDDAAQMIGFSKFHFSRLFKKFTGNTFYSYVNERRIAHATLLLLDPENSITDVAINSGFNSISSFIRIFKISKGCTPTEFRKIHEAKSEISNI